MSRKIWPSILFLSLPLFALAQLVDLHDCIITIPQVAILDIEPDQTPLDFTIQITEAGAELEFVAGASNQPKWLNYTSALAPGTAERDVLVQVTGGNLPPGFQVKLQAATYSGTGDGTMGSPVGEITLSANPQVIITGIGKAYTGNGPNNGHQLIYTPVCSDPSALLQMAGNISVDVKFTITE